MLQNMAERCSAARHAEMLRGLGDWEALLTRMHPQTIAVMHQAPLVAELTRARVRPVDARPVPR
jgi:hypothetical protein